MLGVLSILGIAAIFVVPILAVLAFFGFVKIDWSFTVTEEASPKNETSTEEVDEI